MEKLLTETELADFLEVSVLTVRRNRCAAPHRLPRHVKFGSSVRYRLSTVLEWLEEHEVGRESPNKFEDQTPKKEKRPKATLIPHSPQKRHPGRPTKVETVVRRRQETGQ